MAMSRLVCAGLLWAICLPGAAVDLPLVGEPVVMQQEEVLVGRTEDWVTNTTVPRFGEDERVVLSLEQRLDVPGGGGCNYVLQVWLDDTPLTEASFRPRLLNKAPSFDLKGTEYHFPWYSRTHTAWMTLFSSNYERDMATGEDDFRLAWDITPFVRPQAPLRIRISYAQKNIPDLLGHPASLAVRDAWLGVARDEDVAALQERALADAVKPREVPIEVALPPDTAPGARAYEVQWASRPESPPAQVAFDDLRGWTCLVTGDAEIAVSASVETLLWRPANAKLSCDGGTRPTTVQLRPPQPIPLPDDWDAVNLWVHDDHQLWSAGERMIHATVVVEDRLGNEYEVDLGRIRANYWMVQHGLLGAWQKQVMRAPTRFVGLVLSDCHVTRPKALHLESIAFYRRDRRPFAESPRPEQPSFPLHEDAALPTPPEGHMSFAEAIEGGARFTCAWPAGTLTYEVMPRAGDLGDVSARFEAGGETVRFRPFAGGGIRFEAGGVSVQAGAENATLLDSDFADDALHTRWRLRAGDLAAEYRISYRVRGATLVVDCVAEGGDAAGVRFGKVAGLGGARGIEVPYLMMGQKPGPLVACGEGLFVSCLTDWPNCDFSVSDTALSEPDEGGLPVNGGTRYDRLTDGTRNGLRDRLTVTASPEFADVLPNVPNPPSPHLERSAPYLYFMGDGPQPEFWSILERYGLDHVMAMHFGAIWWTRGGEGFSMRHRPRPEMSEADLARYREQVRALGHLFGLLVEYTDFFPANEHWDANLVSLTSAGLWQPAWYGHHATKPNAYRMLAHKVGALIGAKYPTDAVYLDVHSNVGLWAKDFEAGVPGAGIARDTVLFNGEGTLEVRRQHGIVCSEGIYRWLYAGLTDMDYATWITTGDPASDKPILPDFDLLKLHHLAHGTGMSYSPSGFFGRNTEATAALHRDAGAPLAPPEFYQYVAATIAHGHSAILGYGYRPPLARTIQYYCLLQGLQKEYLTDTPAEILRHDGERFVTTSEMLREGGIEQGRIKVGYSRGLEVCVNYHAEQTWVVELNGQEWTLPPFGWVAEKPGEILAFSALVNDHRMDYVSCPAYVYLNTCGVEGGFGGVMLTGAVWLKREAEGLRVIPCGDLGPWRSRPGTEYPFHPDYQRPAPPEDRGCSEVRIDPAQVAPELAGRAVQVVARDEALAPVGAPAQHDGRAPLTMAPQAGAVDYTIN